MKRNILLFVISLFFGLMATACGSDSGTPVQEPEPQPKPELPDREDNISGAEYDYTVTMAPERPYMHEYDKAMLMKLFMARPNSNGTSRVGLTFEDVLEIVKGIDAITRGLPKIVYLVGWQYEGHDCKYPAFHQFNEALKRPQDATARESFLWLQDEAAKYNTTVSVHILVQDAYSNSPLWQEYVNNDFICKTTAGGLITRAVLNGLPMYDVNIVNEWKKGYLQKRLDELVELVRLDKVKTLHCDAFYARLSPYHHVTLAKTEEVMRKMLRYMRDKEIDVTVEFIHGTTERVDPMFGLSPAAWWFDLTANERAQLPASLVAGGKAGRFNHFWEPEAFMFGDNYQAETDFNYVDFPIPKDILRSLKVARKGIALYTIPYMYFNRHKVEKYDAVAKKVTYSGGLVSDYRNLTVTENGVTLRDHNDIFFPLPWITDHKEIMAFSENGYTDKKWKLPAGWEDAASVMVYPLSEEGLGEGSETEVVDGAVTLTLKPNALLSIRKP